MYMLLDRENMKFRHKHPDLFTIANLAWIEDRNMTYSIFPADDAIEFGRYTDMELKMLYRNTTGKDITTTDRQAIKQILFDIVRRIPATPANPYEADVQAAFILDEDENHYQYVKGAKRPAMTANLFDGITIHSDPVEELEAKNGHLPALKRKSSSLASGTGKKQAQVNGNAPASNKAAPKRGTAKAIIWEVADKMWEKEGKPTQKSEVLDLRKRIMDLLETDEGIKRSSASSELGNWHKTRIPG